MKLISDLKFDIKDYIGDLVIMYHESSRDTAEKIKEALKLTGHVYHMCELSGDALKNRNFVSDTLNTLDSCACLVPIFTSPLICDDPNDALEAERRVFRSLLWYFVGYVRATKSDTVVPFINRGDARGLDGTPLQGIDIMWDVESLAKTLLTKYSTRLLRNNYYKNRTTNLYASRRILYHCLTLKFNVYEKAFQNAKRIYNAFTSRRKTDAAFDTYIEENLYCGCKIISFGSDETLEPQMMVYGDEVHPDIDELPKSLMGKRIYRKLTNGGDIRAELTMDVLIPIHKLLGAHLKAFVSSTDPDCRIEVLLALLEPDFSGEPTTEFSELKYRDMSFWYSRYPAETYVHEKRLYFGLGYKKPKNAIPPSPDLNVGDSIDYVFPQ